MKNNFLQGPMGLADSDSANDPGSNTWWGQRAVYKSGRPKVRDANLSCLNFCQNVREYC